jgi:hypothetical protein
MKTGLLTLFHSRIPSQIALVTQGLEQFHVMAAQSTCDAHPASSGLSGCSAAADTNCDINLIPFADSVQHVRNRSTILIQQEILIHRSIVDDDFAGSLSDADSRYGRFSTPGAPAIPGDLVFLYGYHFFRCLFCLSAVNGRQNTKDSER